MKPLIDVQQLGKRFKRPNKGNKKQHFWALEEVSFQLHRGDSLALMGRNGSGKSTLLKILANILLPTKGAAILRGNVAALLELGAGFHAELTGRENVFLYGAILGFKRRVIRRLFDEIIAFSEIEAFIDSPIKTYSSGMKMRLAFSVAVFLQPDILLVDEILAVGDYSFQKKCFKRIHQMQQQGCSIVFVSHSMASVTTVCNKGLLLQNGKVIAQGQVQEVANRYFSQGLQQRFEVHFPEHQAQLAFPLHLGIYTEKGLLQGRFLLSEPIVLALTFEITAEEELDYLVGFHLYNQEGVLVCPITEQLFRPAEKSQGRHQISCVIPGGLLNTGQYYITAALSSWKPSYALHFIEEQIAGFYIREDLSAREISYQGEFPGIIRPNFNFIQQRL